LTKLRAGRKKVKNGRIKKLLEYLYDGQWLQKILIKGVGPGTVNLCYELGLVNLKRVGVKRHRGIETYRHAVRITKKGKDALEKQAGKF